jgi:transcriptional regulator with XRE-family HTH domain
MFPHLRAWRRAAGLTLHEVAQRLGTTHSTILRYEKGEFRLPVGAVQLLAEIYGCTPAELECDPKERKEGKRVHDAIELAKSLPPDLSKRGKTPGGVAF